MTGEDWNAFFRKLVDEHARRVGAQTEASIIKILEESMTAKTPIKYRDARPGDTIRAEWDDNSYSPRAREDVLKEGKGNWYGGADRHFLLDRPKKLVYAKGTTLYVREGHGWFGAHAGTPVTVDRDFFDADDGDRVVVRLPDGFRSHPGSYRLTDVKPDPHPVGAIRWVTEDTESPFGHRWRKGDRVEVRSPYGGSAFITEVYPHEECGERGRTSFGIKSKFLSATEVKPAPKTITVPRDAVEKLRSEQRKATQSAEPAHVRNAIRRSAIYRFLDEVDSHA